MPFNRNESNPFLNRVILYDNFTRPAERIDRSSCPRYFPKSSLQKKGYDHSLVISSWVNPL